VFLRASDTYETNISLTRHSLGVALAETMGV
jgi:hypothetical protein